MITLLLFTNTLSQNQYIEPINDEEYWDVKISQSNSSHPLLLSYQNKSYFPQDENLVCQLKPEDYLTNDTLTISTFNGTFAYDNYNWNNYEYYNDIRYDQQKDRLFYQVLYIYPDNLDVLFYFTISLNLTRNIQ